GFGLQRFDPRLLSPEVSRGGRGLVPGGRALIDVFEVYHAKERRDLAAAVCFYLAVAGAEERPQAVSALLPAANEGPAVHRLIPFQDWKPELRRATNRQKDRSTGARWFIERCVETARRGTCTGGAARRRVFRKTRPCPARRRADDLQPATRVAGAIGFV